MSKCGDFTTSLGNLVQSSITLALRKWCLLLVCLFLMCKQNFFVCQFVTVAPSFIWHTTEKSLIPSLRLPFPTRYLHIFSCCSGKSVLNSAPRCVSPVLVIFRQHCLMQSRRFLAFFSSKPHCFEKKHKATRTPRFATAKLLSSWSDPSLYWCNGFILAAWSYSSHQSHE